jgi:hypothetical protein
LSGFTPRSRRGTPDPLDPGIDRPVAWTWSFIAEGALAAELDDAKLRFADGRELVVEIQVENAEGTYRVSYYAGLGYRRVDPALRSAN